MKAINNCLYGISVSATPRPNPALTAKIYSAFLYCVNLTVQYVGGDGKAVSGNLNAKTVGSSVSMTPLSHRKSDDFPHRIRCRAGNIKAVGTITVPVCEEMIRWCARIRLIFGFTNDGHSVPTEPLIVERRPCDLALGKESQAALALPISEKEIELRINRLCEEYPVLIAGSEAGADALTRAWISLRGGFDTALMDFDPDDSKSIRTPELNEVIYGNLKHSQRDSNRRKHTPLGFTGKGITVVDFEPFDMDTSDRAPDPKCDGDMNRKRSIVMRELRDHLKQPHHVDLVVRRLFQGQRIVDIAKELDVSYSNARSIVHRARAHLGLTQA